MLYFQELKTEGDSSLRCESCREDYPNIDTSWIHNCKNGKGLFYIKDGFIGVVMAGKASVEMDLEVSRELLSFLKERLK
jgi:hypothetical protein